VGITNRLNSTANILRKARAADGRGGSVITYTTATASVSCRLSMVSSTERFLGDKVDNQTTHKIFVLSSVTVKMHDRFVISSSNYDVVGINNPSRGDHIELDVILLRDDN
jgi:head-tail adaptor